MKIIRADHLGMCFGVRDAIALAEDQARQAPLTVLGDLVHNDRVLADLQARNVRIERDLDRVATFDVMITAHGASHRLIDQVRQRGHHVVEATCPLVRFAHRSVQRLAEEGFHPVIIGVRDHVEVRGLTGDLSAFDVVLTDAEIDALPERPRFGVACQTTQPLDRVHRLLQRLRRRFPNSEVRFVDTVCQPTKLRQSAASELARQSDVVVVIGGAHSNNTRELVGRCSQHCRRVHHVQTADDLQAEWFESGDVVGLTAGTSTPDDIIDAVEQRIGSFSHTWEAPNHEHEHAHVGAHGVLAHSAHD